MNGRDKYAARLAKATIRVAAEKALRNGVKQPFTDSHTKLHKHARGSVSGQYEKFTWQKGDVLEARDGTKFKLEKLLHKDAFHQVSDERLEADS